MKRAALWALCLLTALCLLLAGCGAAGGDSAPQEQGNSSANSSEEAGDVEFDSSDSSGSGAPLEVGPAGGELKIVYTAYLSLETLDYDESLEAISAALQQHGGYIESSEQYGGYRYSSERYSRRSCTLVLRVPTENYSDFLSSAGEFGSLLDRREYTDDITSAYLDTEARLKSLESQRERLLELLAEADSVETLIYIEDTLADVQYEIESYTSRMRAYENQLSYSTVTLDLSEVTTITPVEQPGFLERAWEAVKGSARGVVQFLDSLCIGLIYALPYIVILALLVLVAVRLLRRRRAGKKLPKGKGHPEDTAQNPN